MQYSKFAVVAALAAPLASAQNLSGLPTCAETAAISSLGSTGCALTDFVCICNKPSFLASLTPQVQAACSPSDFAAAIAFAQTLCGSVGVTLPMPGTSPAAPATTPAAPATMPSAPATSPAAPMTTPMTSMTPMTTDTPTVTSAAVVTTMLTTPSASVLTTMAPVSEFTDGQPQVPTNATTIAAPTVTPFKGAATANTAQGAIVGLLAAVGVFVAL